MRTTAPDAATNAPLMQLDFGTTTPEGMMYARRSDETPVYETPNVTYLLPAAAWQLRDRRIYDFAVTNVAAVIIYSGGKINRTARTPQGWAGSDQIRSAVLEEFVGR